MISDIDDTILLTGLTGRCRHGGPHGAAGGQPASRDPRDGVAVPRPGPRDPQPSGQPQPEPTFFYVSTGSWSFYPTLQEFMQLRGFPQGPMFLTDWGPTRRYLRRSGAEHKRMSIRRLIEAYPGIPFVPGSATAASAIR